MRIFPDGDGLHVVLFVPHLDMNLRLIDVLLVILISQNVQHSRHQLLLHIRQHTHLLSWIRMRKCLHSCPFNLQQHHALYILNLVIVSDSLNVFSRFHVHLNLLSRSLNKAVDTVPN